MSKQFKQIIKWIDAKMQAVASWLRKVFGSLMRSLFGSGIICITLIAGFLIDSQSAAVLLVCVGTLFGSVFLIPVMQLILPEKKNPSPQSGSDSVVAKSRQQEIDRLHSQRINVDSITPLLKMSFVQIGASLIDVAKWSYRENGEAKDNEIGPTDIGDYQFVGALRKKFRVNVGADFTKLKVWEDGKSIFVSGLEIGFQGFESLNTKWELREIRSRERFLRSPQNGELVIQPEHPRLNELSGFQEGILQERLNNGAEFEFVDGGVRSVAKEWIRLTLSPLSKPVEFLDQSPVSALSLVDFLRSRNQRISQQINSIERKISDQGIG